MIFLIDRCFIRLSHGLVHLRTCGDCHLPPLFMMHASPASSQSLEGLMLALSETYYCIAPDTFGNGQSDPLESSAPLLADYAAGMDAICDALGLGPIAVYGTHTGAHIAIEWAGLYPKRISHLVLDGVALLNQAMRKEFLEHYAPPQTPQPDGSQFHWAWHFMRDQMIFFPHYKKDLDHLRPGGTFDARILHQLTMDTLGSLETYHLAYEAVFQQDVIVQAAKVTPNTLVLTSDDGPIESGMEPLLEALPKATSVATAGSPAEKAAAMISFFAGV